MARDARNVVITGDRVLLTRHEGDADQGVIERVEPRHGLLSRGSQGREHIIVANIDQVLIVGTAADPEFKPQLIDRYLISAERMGIQPIICINKIDLVDPRVLLPHVRAYGRAGYPVVLTCTRDGRGVAQLREMLAGRQSAVSGQSGWENRRCSTVSTPTLGLRQQMSATGLARELTRLGAHASFRFRLADGCATRLAFGSSSCGMSHLTRLTGTFWSFVHFCRTVASLTARTHMKNTVE